MLDPATRTAQIEVEIDNSQFRLKPGMYARVDFTVERHDNALVVPANALVDVQGKRGVFRPAEGDDAKFQPIEVGLTSEQLVEVASGLSEGDRVVTTGAAALREGDKIVLRPGGGRARSAATRARGGPARGGGRPAGTAAPSTSQSYEHQESRMSIPRFAIQRPIMMAMICSIVVLLGAISLTRLPVDLLPDIQQPTITVRVNYPGVGPLRWKS